MNARKIYPTKAPSGKCVDFVCNEWVAQERMGLTGSLAALPANLKQSILNVADMLPTILAALVIAAA